MNKIYERKCLNCKKKFTPSSSNHVVCSSACAIAHVKSKKEKKAKEDRAKLKDNLTGIPELKKTLETLINSICRELDKGMGCISCGGHSTPQAGHYHTVQAFGSIRFNLHNIHLQDYNCNCAKGGNIHNYDLGLIKMYGKEYWEYVKFELPLKYSILQPKKFELIEYISKAKELLKSLKNAKIEYSMNQRLRLRTEYNKFIGIYTENPATPSSDQ